jgi:hypothetical protein
MKLSKLALAVDTEVWVPPLPNALAGETLFINLQTTQWLTLTRYQPPAIRITFSLGS